MNGPRHVQAIVQDLAEKAGLTDREYAEVQEETYFSLIELMLEGTDDPPPHDALADACERAGR